MSMCNLHLFDAYVLLNPKKRVTIPLNAWIMHTTAAKVY